MAYVFVENKADHGRRDEAGCAADCVRDLHKTNEEIITDNIAFARFERTPNNVPLK